MPGTSPIAQPVGQRKVVGAALVHDTLADPGAGVSRVFIAGLANSLVDVAVMQPSEAVMTSPVLMAVAGRKWH
jgi:hypothetical protein